MKKITEIPALGEIPEGSTEILRVFVLPDGDLRFCLRAVVGTSNAPGWENGDPGYWGIVAVDLIRHAVNALETRLGRDRQDILMRIQEIFSAEWENPTDRAMEVKKH